MVAHVDEAGVVLGLPVDDLGIVRLVGPAEVGMRANRTQDQTLQQILVLGMRAEEPRGHIAVDPIRVVAGGNSRCPGVCVIGHPAISSS